MPCCFAATVSGGWCTFTLICCVFAVTVTCDWCCTFSLWFPAEMQNTLHCPGNHSWTSSFTNSHVMGLKASYVRLVQPRPTSRISKFNCHYSETMCMLMWRTKIKISLSIECQAVYRWSLRLVLVLFYLEISCVLLKKLTLMVLNIMTSSVKCFCVLLSQFHND